MYPSQCCSFFFAIEHSLSFIITVIVLSFLLPPLAAFMFQSMLAVCKVSVLSSMGFLLLLCFLLWLSTEPCIAVPCLHLFNRILLAVTLLINHLKLVLHHIFHGTRVHTIQYMPEFAGCECISALCLPTVVSSARIIQHGQINNKHTAFQSRSHPFMIRQQRSIYENSTSVIHSVLQRRERPPGSMGRVKLATASNPTKQCRRINPDYLPMLFLELNEKSRGQIRVQGMLKKKLMQKSHDGCFAE